MKKHELTLHFQQFVPHEFAEYCSELLMEYKAKLEVKPHRHTKNGDYRPPRHAYEQHKITVNSDLNPYFFLLVYLHEVAHIKTWTTYQRKVAPHGKEWKDDFRLVAAPVLHSGLLPEKLSAALHHFFIKTPATFHADSSLIKVLKSYDLTGDDPKDKPQQDLLLMNLPIGTQFILTNGMRMQSLEKLRTWFLCKNLDNGRRYRVKGSSEVQVIATL